MNRSERKHTILKVLVIVILFLSPCTSYTQSPEEFFNQALKEFDQGNFDQSELYLKKSLSLERNSFVVWYYLGIIYLLEKQYYQSVMSFNEACLLQPTYAKTIMYRGLARQKTTDFEGAMADFSNAIHHDSALAEAYAFRGALFELMGEEKNACTDFAQASQLGDDWAILKHNDCKKRTSSRTGIFAITRLGSMAADKEYGFSSENPIMVGKGPDGGPANERAYLELLRDIHGNPLEYRRVRSCCGYKTKNGIDGYGLLDEYEIRFFDKKGKQRSKLIYMTFYDYDQPKILFGFTTVEPF